MRIIKIIAIGAIGFVLGWVIWKATESGYSQPWEKLSAPPQEVTELMPTGDPPFFIKTSDGSTYHYESWQNEGWLQEAVPSKIDNPIEVKKPCNFRSAEFLPTSNAPRNIKDCFQETTMEPDGYISYAIVLDSDGVVWEWEHIVGPEYINMMFCYPSLGLFIGLLTGFLLASQNSTNVKT